MKTDAAVQPGSLTRGLARWAAFNVFYVLLMTAVLFLAAWRLDWLGGWLYAGTVAVLIVVEALVLVPRSPDLLAERTSVREGTKSYDRVLVRVLNLSAGPGIWIVAGLDARFGWSAPVTPAVQIAGVAVVALAFALELWAMATNRFFAGTVRVQAERGHAVVSSGPYGIVRHPGYAGMIPYFFAAPIVLGAWWALVPAAIATITLIVRTALEDRTLQAELPGYREYTGRVRYRLVPGVW